MKLTMYQIDAFTPRVFGGNSAAMIALDEWLPDDLLQSIAMENNLSETGYFVPEPPGAEADFALRWFTPTVEVDLCGHATYAAAWLLFNELDWDKPEVSFMSRSGVLRATHEGDQVTIDLPARGSEAIDCPALLKEGLGVTPVEVRSGANLMAVFGSESEVAALAPDFSVLKQLHPQGVIATAPGDEVDVVSRYFAPSFGIDEDPVTGSAHADLTPYWTQRLGKDAFSARQISSRVGEIDVRQADDRIFLSGQGVLYMKAEISV